MTPSETHLPDDDVTTRREPIIYRCVPTFFPSIRPIYHSKVAIAVECRDHTVEIWVELRREPQHFTDEPNIFWKLPFHQPSSFPKLEKIVAVAALYELLRADLEPTRYS
ncbi:Hypothetical predicted protein [Olea europaea subsp. europaea]|uniref:Uncharacterized protein n=1 Tax=Olea europaea subsp. europaea TaxID=158383 RepID=A0A8S0PWX2_OLEEU|nr:Hypothetical predicted protein [Olea europaea subsp. europaea]